MPQPSAASDQVRLQHILDAISVIQGWLREASRADLDGDSTLTSGIAYQLVIIGEAAGKLSPELTFHFPEIPWPQVVAMRNLLVHEYVRVDPEIVWETCQRRLDPLRETILTMLADAN